MYLLFINLTSFKIQRTFANQIRFFSQRARHLQNFETDFLEMSNMSSKLSTLSSILRCPQSYNHKIIKVRQAEKCMTKYANMN